MTTITIGGNNYEIHGTESGANAYFAARLDAAAWNDASGTDRKRALITMARWFDRLETNPPAQWTGEKTGGSGQVLSWPRDGATCNGEAVPDGTTPAAVITAEYEGALALLADPSIQTTLSQGTLLKRARAGSAEVEFFGPTRGSADDTPLPAILWQLIGCYLEVATATPPTVEGNTGTSFFESSPNYGLTEGFA